jgi:hypothetical protein
MMPGNLQFDRVEPRPGALSGTMSCSVCGNLLPDTYYVVNGHIVCDKCRRGVEADWNRGGAAGRFGKALVLGMLATIGCSLLWYAVLKATDSQWGILAVVVGLVIGGAVRKGSNNRGGWRYQALAIFLTYTAIVSSYVPFIIEGMREHSAEVTKASPAADSTASATTAAAPTTADTVGPLGFVIGIVLLLAILYATPFLMGVQNLIGILIVGFALYEAWKLNRRAELRVSGPHQVSTSAAPA